MIPRTGTCPASPRRTTSSSRSHRTMKVTPVASMSGYASLSLLFIKENSPPRDSVAGALLVLLVPSPSVVQITIQHFLRRSLRIC